MKFQYFTQFRSKVLSLYLVIFRRNKFSYRYIDVLFIYIYSLYIICFITC